MKISAEQIQENWAQLQNVINTTYEGERLKNILGQSYLPEISMRGVRKKLII